MSGLMERLVAPKTSQVSVEDSPGSTLSGSAVKLMMSGDAVGAHCIPVPRLIAAAARINAIDFAFSGLIVPLSDSPRTTLRPVQAGGLASEIVLSGLSRKPQIPGRQLYGG